MQSDGTINQLTHDEVEKLREQLRVGEDPDLMEIPKSMLAGLEAMNRHDRRAWYARERKRRRASRALPAESASRS